MKLLAISNLSSVPLQRQYLGVILDKRFEIIIYHVVGLVFCEFGEELLPNCHTIVRCQILILNDEMNAADDCIVNVAKPICLTEMLVLLSTIDTVPMTTS